MSEKFYSLVTKIGQAQFANALALDQKVAFGSFAVGDGGGSIYDPREDQTDLKHEVWSGKITSLTIGENNPNELVVETYIPSNKGGFTIREFGIKDSDGNLLVIGKHPETYKPVAADGTAKDITLRVILTISNAQEVILKIDPSVQVATRQDLDKIRADFDVTKGSLASKKDFEDFKTSFEEDKKNLASKDNLDTHIKDYSLHTTKEDKAKLKAIPTNPKYTDTTYTFDKGLTLDAGTVSAKLGDGLDFDTNGNIKASDELARKSYVDKSLEKSAGDMTESLKGYVKKDGDKVLSTNDFTDDLKNRIDRDLRTDIEVVNLARMAVEKEKLFKSDKLYSHLNGFYGTNLSSSINTLDDLRKSDSAMAEILNNKNIQSELDENLVVANLIYENVFPYFEGGKNLVEFEKHIRQNIRTQAIYNNPKYVDLIVNNKEYLNLVAKDEKSTNYFTNNSKYVYRFSRRSGDYLDTMLADKPYKNHTNFLLLAYNSTGNFGLSGPLGELDDGSGRNWTEVLKPPYSRYLFDLEIYKKQKENNDLWKYKRISSKGEEYTGEAFNIVKEYGKVCFTKFNYITLYVDTDIIGNEKYDYYSLIFVDLDKLKADLARGV